eukprot:TRINITY_DN19990_c0_g1_i1.p1 TRINITY_DN19990_c0_g1~~TRINITY_DN19990_c0_g1_i1.p1  ORF type:complete len:611 (+),score=60.66 TRINITY_DN19990_c0_g1_i1:222-1835(+)
MTATWVGGGYINGTAQYVAMGLDGYGLIWAQAPWCYATSLALGGLFFAKIFRDREYLTMLDPLNHKHGRVATAFLYIPCALGDVLWTASILAALGGTLSVILDMNKDAAIIFSAIVSLVYTLFGGLWSVCYTDVIQLICIFIGLWLAVPFALGNEHVTDIGAHPVRSTGSWSSESSGVWIDDMLLMMLGGIPWQVYFQRVLSSRDSATAQSLSFVAAFGALFMAVPAILIGSIGANADWVGAGTDSKYVDATSNKLHDYSLVLPLVLQELCPYPVAVFGLGAVAAAVMSSSDSAVLSTASMTSWNLYAPLRAAITGVEASGQEITIVIRIAILIVGFCATITAIKEPSVYRLFYLCADLVYGILFPQIACVIYYADVNVYGVVTGYALALLLRLGGGEDFIGLSAFIHYPGYDTATGAQRFPYKTLAMLFNLTGTMAISSLTKYLFMSGRLSIEADIFHVFSKLKPTENREFDTDKDEKQASEVTLDDIILEDDSCEESLEADPWETPAHKSPRISPWLPCFPCGSGGKITVGKSML